MNAKALARFAPQAVPGLLALVVFVVLAATEGGFEPTTWYPAAAFLLGLLVVSLLVLGPAGVLRPGTAGLLAIGLFAAFVAWSFLSITWANAKGDAWNGANQALLYLVVFSLFRLLPWRGASAAAFLGTFSVAMAVLAVVTVANLSGSSDPILGLIGGRLAEPTGYHNATAALFLASSFPALMIASRGEVPFWARGLLLAAAVVLVEAAVLPQSRGSIVALPIALVVLAAISPSRPRVLLVLLPVAGATALATPTLLDVYAAVRDGGDVAGAFGDALRVLSISAGVLFAIGCAMGLADRRLGSESPARMWGSRGVGAAGALAAAIGLVVALSATGNPIDWTEERWEDFKSGQDTAFEEDSRFEGSLGTNRYDYWRVAIDRWLDEPLIGLGMDQFASEYAQGRRSDEEPANPHNLGVKVLSQTGLIGALLFFGALVAAWLGGVRKRLAFPGSLEGAVAAAGLVTFAYWFAHGLGDWLWEMPGLAAPAFAALGIAGAVEDGDEETEALPRRSGLALRAGTVLVGLVALVSLALPWLSARHVEIAATSWPADLDGAYERLDRARELNPIWDRPDVIAGTIALRAGDDTRITSAFEGALERRSQNWYPHLILGAKSALDGDRREAMQALRVARDLNPLDPLIARAIDATKRGEPIPLRAIERSLGKRICERLGRTEATPDCD